jgi:hypothetical protein
MRRVELKLGGRSEWVKVFDPRDCTIHLDGDQTSAIGDELRIDLLVGDEGPRVIMRGTVIAHRDEADGSAPAGSTIALNPEEREKINYLNGFVRGGLLNLREQRRLPVRLPITYGGVAGPCATFTRDINEEGVFVVSEDPLPEDSELHLLVSFPGQDAPMSLTGIVSHTVVVEDEDIPGMGVVFKLESDQRTALRTSIDELEAKFLKGELGDEYLI